MTDVEVDVIVVDIEHMSMKENGMHTGDEQHALTTHTDFNDGQPEPFFVHASNNEHGGTGAQTFEPVDVLNAQQAIAPEHPFPDGTDAQEGTLQLQDDCVWPTEYEMSYSVVRMITNLRLGYSLCSLSKATEITTNHLTNIIVDDVSNAMNGFLCFHHALNAILLHPNGIKNAKKTIFRHQKHAVLFYCNQILSKVHQ